MAQNASSRSIQERQPEHPLLRLAVLHAEVVLALAVEGGLVDREDALVQLRRLERLAPLEEP